MRSTFILLLCCVCVACAKYPGVPEKYHALLDKALDKAGQMVLEGHMRCCVREGIQHGDADETIKQFAKAIERFSNI